MINRRRSAWSRARPDCWVFRIRSRFQRVGFCSRLLFILPASGLASCPYRSIRLRPSSSIPSLPGLHCGGGWPPDPGCEKKRHYCIQLHRLCSFLTLPQTNLFLSCPASCARIQVELTCLRPSPGPTGPLLRLAAAPGHCLCQAAPSRLPASRLHRRSPAFPRLLVVFPPPLRGFSIPALLRSESFTGLAHDRGMRIRDPPSRLSGVDNDSRFPAYAVPMPSLRTDVSRNCHARNHD